MHARPTTIGHLSRETGCSASTIRYYEQQGLMPAPMRSAGETRLYGPADKSRLEFIRNCTELGFSQTAIRELLGLADQPEASCTAVIRIAQAHLDEVDRRLARLSSLQLELQRMVDGCRGGRVADCRIIEGLSVHPSLADRDEDGAV